MTAREALGVAEQRLKAARIRNYRVDARVLLAHVLGRPLSRLPLLMTQKLTEAQLRDFRALLGRRQAREPLAYVTGDTEFMGLRFSCDPRVLVPRPDTETLVETVVELLQRVLACGIARPIVAEIGTGSGCVAVSVAHLVPSALVIATDISPEALQVATRNAADNDVAQRIVFLQGDGPSALLGHQDARRADLLAWNPPYIPCDELDALEPEVSVHEPRVALCGGEDGLDMYRQALGAAGRFPHLRAVAFECGLGHSEPVSELLRDHLPAWELLVRRDLGGIQRVVAAWRPDSMV